MRESSEKVEPKGPVEEEDILAWIKEATNLSFSKSTLPPLCSESPLCKKSDALFLDFCYGPTAGISLLQELLGWPEPAGPCCVGWGRAQFYPVTYRP